MADAVGAARGHRDQRADGPGTAWSKKHRGKAIRYEFVISNDQTSRRRRSSRIFHCLAVKKARPPFATPPSCTSSSSCRTWNARGNRAWLSARLPVGQDGTVPLGHQGLFHVSQLRQGVDGALGTCSSGAAGSRGPKRGFCCSHHTRCSLSTGATAAAASAASDRRAWHRHFATIGAAARRTSGPVTPRRPSCRTLGDASRPLHSTCVWRSRLCCCAQSRPLLFAS